MSPVPASRPAYDSGHSLFQVEVPVGWSQGWIGIGNYASRYRADPKPGLLSAAEAMGWRLEHVDTVFIDQRSAATRRALANAGSTLVASHGFVLSVYVFGAPTSTPTPDFPEPELAARPVRAHAARAVVGRWAVLAAARRFRGVGAAFGAQAAVNVVAAEAGRAHAVAPRAGVERAGLEWVAASRALGDLETDACRTAPAGAPYATNAATNPGPRHDQWPTATPTAFRCLPLNHRSTSEQYSRLTDS